MNDQISLGPFTRRVVQNTKWSDSYPATQVKADELEQLLEFAASNDVFDEYLARLQGGDRQRDAALAELRVARYFSLNGYKPQRGTWKPNGGPNSDGEFVIQGPSGSCTVVEVKHRDSQGELTKEEIQAGRARQPKIIDLEVRRIDIRRPIQGAIEKAYGKFDDQAPSLLVVSNDLFWDLKHDPDLHAYQALYSKPLLIGVNPRRVLSGYFTDSRYENLGGVGIFKLEDDGPPPVKYGLELYVNAFAQPTTRLPRDIVKALKGIRLWGDPTNPYAPSAEREHKWKGDDDPQDRDRILQILERKRDDLRRYGAKNLNLFGSAARGENDAASDLDFVVELEPKTFANYMALKEYLEDLFGCRVDLVLADAIKPTLRSAIQSESVHAPGL